MSTNIGPVLARCWRLGWPGFEQTWDDFDRSLPKLQRFRPNFGGCQTDRVRIPLHLGVQLPKVGAVFARLGQATDPALYVVFGASGGGETITQPNSNIFTRYAAVSKHAQFLPVFLFRGLPDPLGLRFVVAWVAAGRFLGSFCSRCFDGPAPSGTTLVLCCSTMLVRHCSYVLSWRCSGSVLLRRWYYVGVVLVESTTPAPDFAPRPGARPVDFQWQPPERHRLSRRSSLPPPPP